MLAAIALHADEAVLEPATREVVAELVEHEPGQRTLAFGEAALEGRQVLLDERVQNAGFRAMALVTQSARRGGRMGPVRRCRRFRVHAHTMLATQRSSGAAERVPR